ncbi:alkaline phosphatase D family protein [Thermaurantiacus tibetensis]|uniref:alkaline phosphatase D family protein n=1 Tax=Thermaurantiacus tibetensis TaxID=2759035 RepID=UPI00188F4DEA|nr:alkaline phosphatase D family protein [Thermaurantiacus tibetensis]
MLDRRTLLATAGAALAAPALARLAAPVSFVDFPFPFGVAAGDPDDRGFVIWTRLAPKPQEPDRGLGNRPALVRYEVSESPSFSTLVAEGEVVARPELGHSVHVTLETLRPDRVYHYRFVAGGERSVAGRARTLPAPGAEVAEVRLGVAGCQDYQSGLYTAFRHLAAEDCHAIFHYGDYMYEYGPRAAVFSFGLGQMVPTVRRHDGPETFSLDDYRRRYSQIRLDLDLQEAHRSAAWLASYDDHEVVNNWAGDVPPEEDLPADLFLLRRAAAMQAWYEFMPVRADAFPRNALSGPWRQYRFGRLLDARLLNTRAFRTNQPCGDRFGSLCPEIRDPKAEMLGRAQEDWLVRGFGEARWNALLQQVMMMNLERGREPEPRGVNVDSWAGYLAPRDRLLGRLERVRNLVVLTGDEHQHWAGEVRRSGARPDSPAQAVEFVTTSISSGSDGPGTRPEHAEVLRRNPGLAYVRDERGYAVMTVTPKAWTCDFRVVDTVRAPGGRLSTHARFRVPDGEARLERA